MEQMVYDGWFGYFSTRWLRNKFRNYDSKTAIGVGIGKELFKNDTQSLKLTLGVSYNFEKYSDNTPDDDFAALTQYIEYSNQINDISSIYLKLGAMENFEDFSNDYELSMVAGIRFAVAKSLNLSLESELDYDNSPSAGYDKTDTKILVKLGYDF
jgi:putative salt-induced outer membrane protein YdiY